MIHFGSIVTCASCAQVGSFNIQCSVTLLQRTSFFIFLESLICSPYVDYDWRIPFGIAIRYVADVCEVLIFITITCYYFQNSILNLIERFRRSGRETMSMHTFLNNEDLSLDSLWHNAATIANLYIVHLLFATQELHP